MVRQPLLATETADKFDVLILADGGGFAGQAGAARLGIARALVEFNAELRARLKEARLPDARSRASTSARSTARRALASGSSSPSVSTWSWRRTVGSGQPPLSPSRLLNARACARILSNINRGRKSRFGPCALA